MVDPIEIVKDLVQLPSINPGFRDVPSEKSGEKGIADYLSRLLDSEGFSVNYQEVFPDRPNLLAYKKGTSERLIILNAHMDTVPVKGMEGNPFAAEEWDGFVCGRGSADTKAAIAAMVTAAIQAFPKGKAPEGAGILLLFTADEEAGFEGSARFIKDNPFDVEGIIIGEPTANRVANCHKGVYRFEVTATGKTAHASVPWQGKNAIYAMGDALQVLREHATALEQGPAHPVLGTPTLNTGTIRGGTAVNSVPESCTVEVDRRILPDETAVSVRENIVKQLGHLSDISVEAPFIHVPGFELSEEHPWAAYAGKQTQTEAFSTVPYATDASILQKGGYPCLVAGPGEIEAAHSNSEAVSPAQVHDAVRLYRQILEG